MQLDPTEEKLILLLRSYPITAPVLQNAALRLFALQKRIHVPEVDQGASTAAEDAGTAAAVAGQIHDLQSVCFLLGQMAEIAAEAGGNLTETPAVTALVPDEKHVTLPGCIPVAVSVLSRCSRLLAVEAAALRLDTDEATPPSPDRRQAAAAIYQTGAAALGAVVRIAEESPEPIALRLRDREPLTREEFLARCATAYDMGLAKPSRLALLERWTDLALRSVAVAVGTTMPGGIYHQQGTRHQAQIVDDLLASEVERLRERAGGGQPLVLASDADGYSLCRLAAILNHPCQQCATTEGVHHTTAAIHEHTPPPSRRATANA